MQRCECGRWFKNLRALSGHKRFCPKCLDCIYFMQEYNNKRWYCLFTDSCLKNLRGCGSRIDKEGNECKLKFKGNEDGN